MLPLQKHIGGLSLRAILPEAQFIGAEDIHVSSCTSDSRRCRPGDLFVALVGPRHDGHDHAQRAIQRGAAGVLTERMLPVSGVPACLVPDTRAAFGRLCQALAGNPATRLKVIGITGTHGKTSASWLIASVLEQGGRRTGLMGTLGYSDTVEQVPAEQTTPGAPVLADWLARMEIAGCSHAVLEVSSDALAQRRVAGIEFDVACLTNVRRDHLDYHGSLTNYRAIKGRIFEQLSPEGFAVLNADDPGAAGYLSKLQTPALTVGMREPAEVTATLVERFTSEQTFLLSAGNDTAPVRTRIIGDGHVANCLVAAAVGLGYGLRLTDIVRGLEAIERLPARLERLECGQPFSLYLDCARTPESLSAALRAVREVCNGRVLCVFSAPTGGERSRRPLLAHAVERDADMAIVTTEGTGGPRTEAAIRHVLSGFEGLCSSKVVEDRAEAIALAISLARPGDTVLIAGRDATMNQKPAEKNRVLDDREIASALLYAAAQQGAFDDFGSAAPAPLPR